MEFSSMQDMLEKAKDIEDSLWYDIGSQVSADVMHSNAYVNHSMVKSSKQMIGAVPRGTARQAMANRQVPKPIQNTSSNIHKIPETSGKQSSKEGELKCYKYGQKGHMQLQCPKLRNCCIAVVREDDSEEIIEVIEENLEEDTKDDVSEEEDVNENSDEEIYLCDEIKYKMNYVRFISNETITEQQMQVASAMVEKLEEPLYNHRARIKERSRPLWKCNDNQHISVFWEVGGVKAHCLINSGCEKIMISPSFIRAAKIEPFPLDKPIGIQLTVMGSKSIINYGENTTIKYNEK